MGATSRTVPRRCWHGVVVALGCLLLSSCGAGEDKLSEAVVQNGDELADQDRLRSDATVLDGVSSNTTGQPTTDRQEPNREELATPDSLCSGECEVGVEDELDAVAYIRRILQDQSPEVMHATETVLDPGVWDSPMVSFDDSLLQPFISELKDLELSAGPLEVQADLAYGPEPGWGGCLVGDFMHCRVRLLDPSGVQVAAVLVDYVGDGVTGLSVEVSAGPPEEYAGNLVAVLEGVDLTGCDRLLPLGDEDEIFITHEIPFPAGPACVDVLREILARLNFDESELALLTNNPQVIAKANRSGDLGVVSVAGAQGFRNIIISTPEKIADYERWNKDRG